MASRRGVSTLGLAARRRLTSYVCPQLYAASPQIRSAAFSVRGMIDKNWQWRSITTFTSLQQHVLAEESAPWRESAARMQVFEESAEVGSEVVTFETGKLAQFAAGAVVCGAGETKVLVTVVSDERLDAGRDFMPLQVEYREKSYAQGKIPNTFMRREGAPKERELLCGRVIDRSIRPLFPKGYYFETQVMASVICSDGEQDPDILAANAASAALTLSDVPWNGPIGVVRIGRVNGKFVVNPDMDALSESDLNLIYSCTAERALMIEMQAREISNDDFTAALQLAHSEAVKLIEPQRQLAEKVGNRKRPVNVVKVDSPVLERVRSLSEDHIKGVVEDPTYGKFERGKALGKVMDDVQVILKEENDEAALSRFGLAFDTIKKQVVRRNVFERSLRVDGRSLTEVRDLYCEAGIYPALHGSSLFSRGNTQVLCTVTLGAPEDAQRLDSIVGPPKKRFMVHYSFPPFSVNEVGKVGGMNRREIGHGTLAEKALVALLPPEDDSFPYTVRVNSEVMASDGSSSMATVCGGSLALMDAGIPLKEHVAGISVGLMTEVDLDTGEIKDYKILTDILGLEDHLGDMDFKIAGTRKGVTAVQLDIKLPGVPLHILCEALEPALVARRKILDLMEKEIPKPRDTQRGDTPRRGTIVIQRDSIGRLIGPQGSNIKNIQVVTGVRITVNEEGTVHIIARSEKGYKEAKDMIENLVGREIQVGGTYTGIVSAIKDFGAFIDFDGGQQGLLHISEISHGAVASISDVLSIGQQVPVLCIGRDFRGNLKFSHKATLPQPESTTTKTITEAMASEISKLETGVTLKKTLVTSETTKTVTSTETQAIVTRKSQRKATTFDLTAERIKSLFSDDKPGKPETSSKESKVESNDQPRRQDFIVSKDEPGKEQSSSSSKPGKENKTNLKEQKPAWHASEGAEVKQHEKSVEKQKASKGAQVKQHEKHVEKERASKGGQVKQHEKAVAKQKALESGLKKQLDQKKKEQKGDVTEDEAPAATVGGAYHVTVEQVRKYGLVLKLASGTLGALRLGKETSPTFAVGEKLKVKCTSLGPKGRPNFELRD